MLVSADCRVLRANEDAAVLVRLALPGEIRSCARRVFDAPAGARVAGFTTTVATASGVRVLEVRASLDGDRALVSLTPARQDADRDEQSGRIRSLGERVLEIAHELRKPLAPIGAYASLLGSELDDEDLKGHAEMITASAERLSGTLNGLLDFARPGLLTREPASMGDMVADAWSRAMVCAARPGVSYRMETDVAAGADGIVCDGERLGHALFNIFTNAIEAMPGGGVVAVTGVRSLRRGAAHSVIEVRDTGAGIDPADLPRVREPFFTTRDAGVGLGLAVVEKSVSEHGGELAIESRPGEGTTVRVILPCEAAS